MRLRLAVVVCLVFAPVLQAQMVPVSPFQGALVKLRVNDIVRAKSVDWSGDGQLVQASDDSLVVRNSFGKLVQIERASIDSMWVYQRATGAGAKRGALIVGIPSAIFLGFLARETSGDTTRPRDVAMLSGALHGAAYGGAIGGSIGAAIGSTTEQWKRIYPAR